MMLESLFNKKQFKQTYDTVSGSESEDGISAFSGDSHVHMQMMGVQDKPTCMGIIADWIGGGTVIGSSFTMIAGMIGISTLATPWMSSNLGFSMHALLWTVFAILIGYSLRLLVLCCDYCNESSYRLLSYHVFQTKRSAYFIQFAIMLNLWGNSAGYMVALRQMLAPALDQIFGITVFDTQYGAIFLLLGITFIWMLPISLVKDIGMLASFSMITLLCFTYLTFLVILKFFLYASANEDLSSFPERMSEVQHFNVDFIKVLEVYPIMITAFSCHPVCLPTYKDLNISNKRNMYKVINIALVFVTFSYIFVGGFGHLTAKIPSTNLLDGSNYASDDIAINIASLLLGLSLSVSIPVFCFTTRINVEMMFQTKITDKRRARSGTEMSWPLLPSSTASGFGPGHDEDNYIPLDYHFWRSLAVSIVFLGSGFAIGISVDDITDILSLLGASTGTIIAFLMPPLYYIKITGREKREHKRIKFFWRRIRAGCVCFVLCSMSAASLFFQLNRFVGDPLGVGE